MLTVDNAHYEKSKNTYFMNNLIILFIEDFKKYQIPCIIEKIGARSAIVCLAKDSKLGKENFKKGEKFNIFMGWIKTCNDDSWKEILEMD